MNKVKVFCLLGGQNIIAEVLGTDAGEHVGEIESPMSLVLGVGEGSQTTVAMYPFDIFNSKSVSLILNRDLVLFEYEADDAIKNQYKIICDKVRASRAGIILPTGADPNKVFNIKDFKKR